MLILGQCKKLPLPSHCSTASFRHDGSSIHRNQLQCLRGFKFSLVSARAISGWGIC